METKKEKKMKPWVIVRPRKAKEWVIFAMMILSLLSMISPVVNLFNIPCMLLGMPVLFIVSIISLIVTVIVINIAYRWEVH